MYHRIIDRELQSTWSSECLKVGQRGSIRMMMMIFYSFDIVLAETTNKDT